MMLILFWGYGTMWNWAVWLAFWRELLPQFPGQKSKLNRKVVYDKLRWTGARGMHEPMDTGDI